MSKTKMPSEVYECHDSLGKELFVLFTKWKDYNTLYCTADETVQLLDYAASFFFQIIGEVLRDDIILNICRITDPAESMVRGKKRNNLTIEYLISIIPTSETTLTQKLNHHLQTIKNQCDKFREHRNRRIGHHDLDTTLKRSTVLLPNIGIQDAEVALKSIADALNLVEQHYDHNEQSYEEGIYGSGDGQELIDFIKYEKDLLKYFHRKEFGDDV